MVDESDLFIGIREKRQQFLSKPDNNHKIYAQIIDFLTQKLNLNFACYRESYVRRRIEAIMSRLNIETYREFYEWLHTPLFDKDVFIKRFTINVTEFFRDVGPFRHLESKILPELVKFKLTKGSNTLNIWSAGCATGEEPYSLAIILDWYLKRKNLQNLISVKILATDLDPEPVSRARTGIYNLQQLRNISEVSRQRNFEHFFGDKYGVKEHIKAYVDFQTHDLLGGELIGIFDLILCRNVLIYVNKDDQIQVLQLFWNSLADPGYLILGKTEVFPIYYKNLFACENLNEHVYKKRKD